MKGNISARRKGRKTGARDLNCERETEISRAVGGKQFVWKYFAERVLGQTIIVISIICAVYTHIGRPNIMRVINVPNYGVEKLLFVVFFFFTKTTAVL